MLLSHHHHLHDMPFDASLPSTLRFTNCLYFLFPCRELTPLLITVAVYRGRRSRGSARLLRPPRTSVADVSPYAVFHADDAIDIIYASRVISTFRAAATAYYAAI